MGWYNEANTAKELTRMLPPISEHPLSIPTHPRNQEWLVAAKRSDTDPHCHTRLLELLPHIDPYENKCMLVRCCAQFGYLHALKLLVRVAPSCDWEKVSLAAVMGQQKAAVEIVLPHIDPEKCLGDGAVGPAPHLALRVAIESGQDDVVRLLVAILPPLTRNEVLLWALEEYQYACHRQPSKVEAIVRGIDAIYPTAPAIQLLKRQSELSDMGRELLAARLAADAAFLSQIGFHSALRKSVQATQMSE